MLQMGTVFVESTLETMTIKQDRPVSSTVLATPGPSTLLLLS